MYMYVDIFVLCLSRLHLVVTYDVQPDCYDTYVTWNYNNERNYGNTSENCCFCFIIYIYKILNYHLQNI